MAAKLKTLTVQVMATVEIDYSQEELDKLGGDFRSMKTGVERLIAQDLLPTFQEDGNTRVHLSTIGFPTSKKLKALKGSK